MPSLRTPYTLSHPPQHLVELLTEEGGYALVPGIVDSGADRSMFPLEIADLLGVLDDLVEDDELSGGASGPPFKTWSSPVAMTGQIIRLTEKREAFPWGPEFAMNPAFTDTDAFLLGREDFFVPFIITFGWEDDQRAFELTF